MSPEQIHGEDPAASWDLWALAVVAFEMLTGVRPFATTVNWRSALIEGRLPRINTDAPALTPALKEFFGRALSVNRSCRPASAERFIEVRRHQKS